MQNFAKIVNRTQIAYGQKVVVYLVLLFCKPLQSDFQNIIFTKQSLCFICNALIFKSLHCVMYYASNK